MRTSFEPRIHLVTVVGEFVKALPHMLRHYSGLGIESMYVQVIAKYPGDPVIDEVYDYASTMRGVTLSVTVGNWQPLLQPLYQAPRNDRPNDWFVLADQDEFHLYDCDLQRIIEICERRGYHYVRGCLIDRLMANGRLGAITRDRPIWDQFPLGAFIGYPLFRADPRKVVLAKGWVPIIQGQHLAYGGNACPACDFFVQVHHFKWTEGLYERLSARSSSLKRQHVSHWKESQRFVDYYVRNAGQFQMTDRRLLVASCDPEYRHWSQAKRIALSLDNPFRRIWDSIVG